MSSSETSAPVGLPGELTMMPRVREVTAPRSVSAVNAKPSSTWVRTMTGVASASLICSTSVGQPGMWVITSSPAPNSASTLLNSACLPPALTMTSDGEYSTPLSVRSRSTMARFRSSVPEFAVYLVKFASIARWAAADTCDGVGKSGSPAPKSTISTPCAFSFMASAATFIVGETEIRVVRAARFMGSGFQGFAGVLLVAQPRFDDRRHEIRDRPAKGDHFLHEPRADVGVRFGWHHEDGLHLGIEVAVHQRHLHFVLEIGNRAQPAHDHARPLPA